MESVLLLVLFLVGILIVLPIWTLVSLSNLRRENRELARRLALLEAGAGAVPVVTETSRGRTGPNGIGPSEVNARRLAIGARCAGEAGVDSVR